MSEQFRTDNTEGYDANDLAALNRAWAEISSPTLDDSDTDDTRSMLHNWSEQLLAAYDDGKRGDELLAWFYE